MPRSERCRIRGNYLHGIALPFLAQAPIADGTPAAGGAPWRGSSGPGFWRPIGPERAVTVARAWGGFGRAVESRQRGSEDRRGMGRKQAVE